MEDLKIIFSSVLCGGIDVKSIKERFDSGFNETDWYKNKKATYHYAYPVLFERVSINIFTGEYHFLYEVLKNTENIVFTHKQLEGLLDTHKEQIKKNKSINISSFGGLTLDINEDTRFNIFKKSVLDLYTDLSVISPTIEEFDTALTKYVREYVELYLSETYANCSLILRGGLDVKVKGKREYLQGLDGNDRYLKYRMEIVDKLSVKNVTGHTVIGKEWLSKKLSNGTSLDEGILDTGISDIDRKVGKWRRTNLVTIAGASKGGKTRFSNYLVYRARQAGLNVCVWHMEGTEEEWVANQIACAIRAEEGINYGFDSKRILENRFDNDATKQLMLAYELKFATDEKLGKLSFIGGTAYVEDFLDKIDRHYNTENQFDVLVLDQLLTVQSKGKQDKVQRISEAYIKLKNAITTKWGKPLVIAPTQLKPGVVEMLRAKKDSELDINSIAECSEIIRSSDEIIGLYSNKEDKESKQMSFYSIASRHSEDFGIVTCTAELGSCYFADKDSYSVS